MQKSDQRVRLARQLRAKRFIIGTALFQFQKNGLQSLTC
jgi:hypothetical protein